MKANVGLVAVVLAVSALSAQAQTVYKCKSASGQVSFQQAPCDGHRTGALAAPQANVIEGKPAGDQETRREAVRKGAARDAIARGEIVEGMTAEDVRQVLGQPSTINTTIVNGKARQQMVYRYPDGSARYVYTGEDGGVESQQQYPGSGRVGLQPCYTPQQIRNAEMEATSATRTDTEKRVAKRKAEDMRSCMK